MSLSTFLAVFSNGNPIQQKLDPHCKTTRVGANCLSLIDFLGSHGIFPGEEVAESRKACKFMTEDMNRCRRAEWVLNQYEIFFEPRLGAHPRSVTFSDEQVDCVWQVVAVRDGFVIADKSDLEDQRCK
jgi:hypothetical protein